MKIDNIIRILKKEMDYIPALEKQTRDPFLVLVACLISLRTKDEVTDRAADRLFKLADNPRKISRLTEKQIEKAIYPAGFYKTKAKRIKDISRIIATKYNSKVPNKMEELLNLHGVGRKTANLVLSVGYKKHAICVDTHVHRISNRLGLVKTKTPHQTEFALRKTLPKKHWKTYNSLLVAYGKTICTPISPFCSRCKIRGCCKRVDVKKSR